MTVNEAHLQGQEDSAVLAHAGQERRAVLTMNCRDFLTLHDTGQKHVGIIGSPDLLRGQAEKPDMRLYRPSGLHELKLIAQADYRAFPPRLPEQPIFHPVLNFGYAEQIARDWNTKKQQFRRLKPAEPDAVLKTPPCAGQPDLVRRSTPVIPLLL